MGSRVPLCSDKGDITLPFSGEFSNLTSALRSAARKLAKCLGAELVGDGGELYE